MRSYISLLEFAIRQYEGVAPLRSIARCGTGHVDRTCIQPEALFEISSSTSSFIKYVHGFEDASVSEEMLSPFSPEIRI
jgi:hypothetical protein